MPLYVLIGKRRNDVSLMMDFEKQRGMVRSHTARVDGVYLEKVPDGMSGMKAGMILIDAKWNHLYFLRERREWTDEDYFELAERLIEQRGITEP